MQTKYELRYAAHPNDVKHYDTTRLREAFLIDNLFQPDSVNITYTMYDRMIVGGAMPVNGQLKLESIEPLKAPYFTTRREVGIFNVGGSGTVTVGQEKYHLAYKDALYIGSGERDVFFESDDANNPARYYFNSTTAHTAYPCQLITKTQAQSVRMGTRTSANERTINKMLVNQVLKTCQLQMGMTELENGSVWNTMPPHTHSRRMEAYFYFELPQDDAVLHLMGQPEETRHIWIHNHQAVISPEWSIHAAAATHNYTFIWGMGGENMDYGDQDFYSITQLK